MLALLGSIETHTTAIYLALPFPVYRKYLHLIFLCLYKYTLIDSLLDILQYKDSSCGVQIYKIHLFQSRIYNNSEHWHVQQISSQSSR